MTARPAILLLVQFLLVRALTGAQAGAEEVADYLRDVRPILKERCFSCHGALKQKAGLRLDSAELLRKGSKRGPAVVPGNAAASLLIERVTAGESDRMPPEGLPLSGREVAVLRAWIEAGALAPADEVVEEDPLRHWAFVQPVPSPLPSPRSASWARSPIDLFVAAEHEKREVEPLPEADPGVLLRRLTFDLSGLPPTREEVHDFRTAASVDADPSGLAYERAADRLLASPRYGERWGRHWMDVWRYSDWYGRRVVPDVMNSYPHVWRWRDWIVRSLNADLGYDRMVVLMLAADEVEPLDDESVVATGFLVRNWFKWNYNQWMKDCLLGRPSRPLR